MGYPEYTVSREMKYIGRPAIPSMGKVMSDVFVKDVDGVLLEVVGISRCMVQPGYYYAKGVPGPKRYWGGLEYTEDFFRTNGDEGIEEIVAYIAGQGYKFDGNAMVGLSLLRKVNNANMMVIFYACSEALLPKNASVNDLKDSLRNKFAETISVPDAN